MEIEHLKKQLASWRDKLLDLNRRNKLIHTKVSAKSLTMLPIVDELPWQVYKHLSSQRRSFGFLPNEQLDADLNSPVSIRHEVPRFEPGFVAPEYKKYDDDQLQTNLPSGRLQTVLSNIQRRSKSSIEEQGFNTLYLTLGILEWLENPTVKNSLCSPLILMPVELKRKDFGKDYRLKFTGDEIVFNPALVQKLIQLGLGDLSDIQNSLENDDEELCIEDLFTRVHEILQIDKQEGWSIKNQVYLGLFSFTKLSLYTDLKKSEDLFLNSNTIQRLCGGGNASADQSIFEEISTTSLDSIESLAFFPIMDADSSQQKAVLASKKGLSFVLQGPPGTGKSQTIANIISEAVANKKTVLFVSEKMAALNVVKDRLASKGLGQYALELHSHKAQKKAVLQELDRCLSNRAPVLPTDNNELEELDKIKNQLNTYGKAILEPRGSLNKSFYEVVSLYESLCEIPTVTHNINAPLDISAEVLRTNEELLNRFESFYKIFGETKNNLFYGINLKAWDLMLDQNYQTQLNEIISKVSNVDNAIKKLNAANFAVSNFSELNKLSVVRNILTNHQTLKPDWYADQDNETLKHRVISYIEEQKPLIEQRDVLADMIELDRLTPETARTIIEGLRPYLAGLNANLIKIPVINLFFSDYRKTASSIQGFLKRAAWNAAQIFDLLHDYLKWCEKIESLNQKLEKEMSLFTNQPQVLSNDLDNFYTEINRFENELSEIKQYLTTDQAKSYFQNKDSYLANIDEALSSWQDFENICSEFIHTFSINDDSRLVKTLRSETPQAVTEYSNKLLSEKGRLKEWTEYLKCLDELADVDIQSFAQPEQGSPKEGDLAKVYRKAFFLHWLTAVQRLDPAIGEFSLERMNNYVSAFQKIDKQLIDNGSQRVLKLLEERSPNGALQVGEPGILKKEAKKKRKIKPIRRLFSEIPNLIKTLKPVFLMSPLSVAMYLEPNKIDFDLVVFDEASQIFPEDAVGALIRGKQVIVVGDSKQMPPTNFFNSSKFGEDSDSDENEDYEVIEMESILDFAETSLNSLTLNWHYRSKHEHLISFSNDKFYENRLITFPSTSYQKSLYGLHFNHVPNGIYDAGKSRANQNEAQTIVNRILEFIKEFPGLSLGVIAMSQAQQDCILNLLENTAIANKNKALMALLSRQEESLFVKNLENVQGDERDVILLSIGYGKDHSGVFRKSFGPLNREGGERRLNVAVSRARKRLEVFASFLPEDLDLSTSKSKGAHLLKNYLAFARNPDLIIRDSNATASLVGSDFEESVKTALEMRDLKVGTQIGCSGYRIDLAIVHPNYPGKYILGVECDGAAYHSSQAARDRDRLRQAVLENMGWKVYRIWSTDWLLRKEEILDEICDRVESLTQQSLTAFESFEPVEAPVTVSTEEETLDNMQLDPVADEALNLDIFEPYKFADTLAKGHGLDDFNDAGKEQLALCFLHILAKQAPISVDELYRTTASYYEVAKVGSRIRLIMDKAAKLIPPTEYELRKKFYYPKDQENFKPRLWQDTDKPRPIDSFAPEELTQVITKILEYSHQIEEEELIKCAAEALKYKRRGAQIVSRFQDVIKTLKKAGEITEVDGHLIKSS